MGAFVYWLRFVWQLQHCTLLKYCFDKSDQSVLHSFYFALLFQLIGVQFSNRYNVVGSANELIRQSVNLTFTEQFTQIVDHNQTGTQSVTMIRYCPQMLVFISQTVNKNRWHHHHRHHHHKFSHSIMYIRQSSQCIVLFWEQITKRRENTKLKLSSIIKKYPFPLMPTSQLCDSFSSHWSTWYIISVVYFCMYVCNMTFESLAAESTFLHIPYTLRGYGSRSYIKVNGSTGQGQGHRSQKNQKSLFLQCKSSIGNNSGSIKHRAIKSVSSMGLSAITDQMVWPPSLSHDRKWLCVTKCMHLQVVGVRLKGNYVLNLVSLMYYFVF